MNRKSIIGNITVAFAAQGMSMVASVIMSLLVPKVLGVTNYGYWQLFIFYTSYSGFFHFGLNDGLYLLLGGKARDSVDKKTVSSQFRFAVAMQLIIGSATSLLAIWLAPDQERIFVLIAFSAFTTIYNLSSFLGYLFQAMNETKLFSLSTILDRIVFLLPMLVMVALGVDDFKPYIITYILARTCCLAYCCFHARDILKAGFIGMRSTARAAFQSIKIGFSLMLANIGDSLILGATRFFIDSAWGVEVFGSVSFALSLVNFFIVFVSQAAMVLFPALRQGTEDERRSFYRAARDLMEMVFPVVYAFYYPMCALLTFWLPQYEASMTYFAMLLPVCVFNTKMNICCTTYFKVMRMERLLLAVNLVTFSVSAIAAAICIWLLGSVEAALLTTVVCIMCRSLWCERFLDRKLKVKGSLVPVSEVVLTFIFVVLSLCFDYLVAIALYLLAYALYFVVNRVTFLHVIRRLACRD